MLFPFSIYRAGAIVLLFLLLYACGNTDTSEAVSNHAPVVETPLPKQAPSVPVAPKTPVIDYDTTQWLELSQLDSDFILDLRYATDNNFVEEKMYDCGRCFLRPEAARRLVELHEALKKRGHRIKLLDCYRPRPIQQKLWDKVPNASYVTPPHKGSMHNRGKAVDLTLTDEAGVELDMGTEYDYFGREAHHTHTDLPETVLANRRFLKEMMRTYGFGAIRTEWWHYNFKGPSYPLDDWLWPCPQ